MSDKFQSIKYWRELNPQCSISDNPWPSKINSFQIQPEEIGTHVEQIIKDGYFQTNAIIPKDLLAPLIKCIVNLVRAGHRTTYALLYDEFYHVLSGLNQVLTPVLGKKFQLVPDEFEAFYVPISNETGGSPPHRDSLNPSGIIADDGKPLLVNVWIPLTDATHLNSCMYVVPSSHQNSSRIGLNQGSVSLNDLQKVRALPAPAGSIICWSPSLLHWGAQSSQFAQEPRLSFAAYFQSSKVKPFHPTTMDIGDPIPFEYRMYLTEKVWRDPKGEMLSDYI